MAELTKRIADDWKQSNYYERAERDPERFWGPETIFRRCFKRLDPTHIIELAVGHGRHVPHYEREAKTVTLVDVNEENIEHCRERFSGKKFVLLQNDGTRLDKCESGSYSAIFCYDAMVHFELADIAVYLEETFRVLRPGGRALFHHSNFDSNPGGYYTENPHWRNFMSQRIFAHLAIRAGLEPLEQNVIDWGLGKKRRRSLDCLTLLEKPA